MFPQKSFHLFLCACASIQILPLRKIKSVWENSVGVVRVVAIGRFIVMLQLTK